MPDENKQTARYIMTNYRKHSQLIKYLGEKRGRSLENKELFGTIE